MLRNNQQMKNKKDQKEKKVENSGRNRARNGREEKKVVTDGTRAMQCVRSAAGHGDADKRGW